MPARVEEIDARTASDDVLHRIADVEHACWSELCPGEPLRSHDEVAAFLRHQPDTHQSFDWLAEGGAAALYVHGPAAAFVSLLVAPDARRSGIGSALLARVVEKARAAGAIAIHGHHTTPAGAAFAASAGAVDGQRDVKSLLDLRAAELPAPAPPEGWRLLTWLGRVPDEHVASFVRARDAMNDAPTPEGMEFPAESLERVRAMEESLVARRREMRVTVAIDAGGEIGAFTDLRVTEGSTLALTDDTGTVAAHRGRGLATAVKLESLRRLRDDHPEIDVVTTFNAEDNAAMRHVNEKIGFRPTAIFTTSTLSL